MALYRTVSQTPVTIIDKENAMKVTAGFSAQARTRIKSVDAETRPGSREATKSFAAPPF